MCGVWVFGFIVYLLFGWVGDLMYWVGYGVIGLVYIGCVEDDS